MADLSIIRGDDYQVVITLTRDGNPFDLTGYVGKAQIRPTAVVGSPLTAEFVVEIDADPTSGVITCTLDNAITETLNAPGVWDLEITSPDGWVSTVVSGAVSIVPDVTRVDP